MRSNASFRKDAGSSAPTKGVVCLRCHLHRKVRDVGVIVMVDIMVMVWGQIFSRKSSSQAGCPRVSGYPVWERQTRSAYEYG